MPRPPSPARSKRKLPTTVSSKNVKSEQEHNEGYQEKVSVIKPGLPRQRILA